ncbi:centrosomal protein of 89 kDa-like isoform X2 [Lineus longissimus]|uniref:centrosomal protein of 89 kDa-like isoform X2 n=1 Tax=Lineus longissimus TaxID=88925 RepID=UPI00315D6F09
MPSLKPKSSKKKKNKNAKPHIAAALVPTASFSAVPRTPPPPSPDPQFTSGMASALMSSTMLGRLFAEPVPQSDDNDVDTSLDDYGDPGYSLARDIRRDTVDRRGRLGTPPNRDEVDADLLDDEEDPLYQLVDRQYEVRVQSAPSLNTSPPHVTDIYAVPKRKVVATEARRDESGVDMGGSLDYLDNLERLSRGNVNNNVNEEEDEYRQKDTPRMAALKEQNQSLMQRQEAIENELQEQRRHQEQLQQKLEETERHLGESQSPLNFSNDRELLMDQQMSLTDNTLKSQEELIRTLQTRVQTLEHERVEHQEASTQLQNEIQEFRKYVHKKDGDVDASDTVLLRRQTQDLKDECDTLKSTVHRLNIELSRQQAKYRPTDKENKNVVGLPSKGPIPSWLLNTKYLAPLFLAYDDRIQEKDDLLRQYDIELETFRVRIEEVLKENQRLHLRLEQTDISGPISMTEWQQLQEQARLVLEENQLLMEQLEVQQNKSKDVHMSHVQEIARLSKQVVMSESEKNDFENEIAEWKQRFMGLKTKHQAMLLEDESKLTIPEHNSAVNEVRKAAEDMKQAHGKEVEDMMTHLHTTQLEKKNLALQVSDLSAENKQLAIEIKGLQRSYRKCQKKVIVLQKALAVSENKEMSAQEYLGSLVKVAEKTAVERDTYAKLVQNQEKERKKALGRMMDGNTAVGEMEERLRAYKHKAADKMLQIANKMKVQDEEFTKQRMEYLTEIKHLRGLLKEKDGLLSDVAGEKKQVEDDLEIMWQAATADNRRMQDTMERTFRKLREHKALEFMFGEDPESNALLGFSSDNEA